MSHLFIPIADAIHTEIDVQYNYVVGLSKERQKSFPKENEELEQELENRGIETVKVAIGRELDSIKLYDKEDPDVIAAKAQEVKLCTYTRGQKLLVKADQDMFACPPLGNYIAEQKKSHIIVNGITTRECVIFSLNSPSRPPNVTYYVVYDLLADPLESKPNDPMWHREYLERNLPNRPDIIYVTQQELLNALGHESKPAPPVKATPVPNAQTFPS